RRVVARLARDPRHPPADAASPAAARRAARADIKAGRHAHEPRSCARGRRHRTHACRPRDPPLSGPTTRALEPDLLGLQVLADLPAARRLLHHRHSRVGAAYELARLAAEDL